MENLHAIFCIQFSPKKVTKYFFQLLPQPLKNGGIKKTKIHKVIRGHLISRSAFLFNHFFEALAENRQTVLFLFLGRIEVTTICFRDFLNVSNFVFQFFFNKMVNKRNFLKIIDLYQYIHSLHGLFLQPLSHRLGNIQILHLRTGNLKIKL